MPRYYFDTIDNGRVTRDNVGVDLPNDEAARQYVGTLLPNLAHQGLPDGDRHTFECSIRDETGVEIYHAELTYKGTRIGKSQP